MSTQGISGGPLAPALEIQGWMSERELGFLHGVALSIPDDAKVVEVGSWKGRSTVGICQALKHRRNVRLWAVDTWEGDTENVAMRESFGDELAKDVVFDEFSRNTADYPFLETIRAPSDVAAQQFEDQSLDWVFIDAEHTFDHLLLDIRSWLPKVKPGGLVSGHDYTKLEVRSAVGAAVGPADCWETVWYARRGRNQRRTRPLPFAIGKLRRTVRTRMPALERRLQHAFGRRSG